MIRWSGRYRRLRRGRVIEQVTCWSESAAARSSWTEVLPLAATVGYRRDAAPHSSCIRRRVRGCWLVVYIPSLVTETALAPETAPEPDLWFFFMLSLLMLLSEAPSLLDALLAVAAAAEAQAEDAQLNTKFVLSRSVCFALLLSMSFLAFSSCWINAHYQGRSSMWKKSDEQQVNRGDHRG